MSANNNPLTNSNGTLSLKPTGGGILTISGEHAGISRSNASNLLHNANSAPGTAGHALVRSNSNLKGPVGIGSRKPLPLEDPKNADKMRKGTAGGINSQLSLQLSNT